jgi:hypothetical protein
MCAWKRLFFSFISLVNMNSKPENRVRTEDSMGPRVPAMISLLKVGFNYI